jgi:glycosyltransferase involved in cell wall biosynthesis
MAVNNSPSVAVVIPAYNSARYLAAALKSIFAQTCPPHEVIVVNDGSTDNTDEIVRSYMDRITYVTQSNQGVSRARNAGLRLVSSDYVIFLDADDRLVSNAVETYLREATPARSDLVLYGDMLYINELTGERRTQRRPQFAGLPPAPAQCMFRTGGWPPSAFMVSTVLARRIGGFDPHFSYAADLLFFLRCGTVASFQHVPEVVVHYFRHAGAMSNNVCRAVSEVVDSRMAYLAWCDGEGFEPGVGRPSERELITRIAEQYFYSRDWRDLDLTLRVGAERGLLNGRLYSLNRMRRLPAWLFRLKDWCDRLRSGAGSRAASLPTLE